MTKKATRTTAMIGSSAVTERPCKVAVLWFAADCAVHVEMPSRSAPMSWMPDMQHV